MKEGRSSRDGSMTGLGSQGIVPESTSHEMKELQKRQRPISNIDQGILGRGPQRDRVDGAMNLNGNVEGDATSGGVSIIHSNGKVLTKERRTDPSYAAMSAPRCVDDGQSEKWSQAEKTDCFADDDMTPGE